MSIESFGYQVMSLRELITELQSAASVCPALLDRPVWTSNMQPLHFPVREVERDIMGIRLVFERGGS